ncbi:hypothetical protein CASFOL_033831 [Castilleja foliolosa]|uniref:Zinc finger PHD-type domain-containing protein n=1 Tax=Castilleja foliolosa TaxID=1961234 RepID=A0ABD3C0K1_9LAMI
MEFKHFSHHHSLFLHQPPQGSHDIHCSGCKSRASDDVYVCWQCNYFLHGQCLRATRSLRHPSHPHHPLTLVPFPTHPSGSFICNTCHISGDAFSYTCSACEFDIHIHCAQLNASNPSFNNPIHPPPIQTSPYPTYPPPPNQSATIPNHYTQDHPLNTNNFYPNFTHTNTPPPNETQNYNSAFHQTPVVHQNPAFPQSFVPPTTNNPLTANPPPPPQPKPTSNIIKHFSHPHMLKLMEIEKKNAKICSACECELSGSAYCCTEALCPFKLHKICFDSPRELRHKSHLQHQLTLMAAPLYSDGFTCNACLKDGKAFVYTCATCSYDLHIDCVQWPDKVTRRDHNHDLPLYYSLLEAETSKDVTFMCDVCENPVHDMAWVYYCRECDFGTHLECATSGFIKLRRVD